LRLFRIIRDHRIFRERKLQDVAKEMKINASTLSRIERGKMPNAATMRRVVIWLMEEEEK
jgi:transcriptional regulator with XRE-family HTH domain